MTIPFSQVKPASLKMKVLARYPAKYLPGPGIAISQEAGVVTTSVDFTNLTRDDITDPTTLYVGAWDNVAKLFKLVIGANLKGAKGDQGTPGLPGPSGDLVNYQTRALAVAATIGPTVNFIRTAGYATVGDGGEALYKRGAWTYGGFTSADGQNFALVPDNHVWNPRQFGAKGDTATDDTAAIQNTILAAQAVATVQQTVSLPDGWYLISSALAITKSIELSGTGKLYGTFNGPYITVDASAGDIYDLKIKNISAVSGNVGTRTSEAFIKLKGSGNIYYSEFSGLTVEGLYHFFDLTTITGLVQWTRTTNFRTRNSGALNVEYFWRNPTGVSGSQLFANGVCGTTTSGFDIGDGVTNGVGDTVFSAIQFNGAGNAIKMTGKTGVYGSNVKIMGCDFDAGVAIAINFTNMNNFTVQGCSFGGGTSAYNLTNCWDYRIDNIGGGSSGFGGQFETRGLEVTGLPSDVSAEFKKEWAMNSKNGLAANATITLFTIDMSNSNSQGVYVKVVSGGFQQASGLGFVTSEYMLARNGGVPTIAATLSNTAFSASLTHSMVVSGNSVLVKAVSAAGNPGSVVSSRIELTGQYKQLIRN